MTIQPSSLITTKAPHPQSVLRSKYRREITTGLVKQVALLQARANMGHLLPPELPLPCLRWDARGGEFLPRRGRHGRRAAFRAWLLPTPFLE